MSTEGGDNVMAHINSNFDYSKLRGRIKEMYGSEGAFAAQVGMSTVSLSSKFNGKSRFTQDNIKACAKALNLKGDEIGIYFFTDKL